MMMRYRRSKDKQKMGIAVLLMLLAVSVISFGRGRELFENVTSPLVGVSASANSALSLLGDEAKSRTELQNELRELREENRTLSLENLNQQILKEHNKELKEQLGWTKLTESFTISRIISRPPITPFDSLTVQTSTKKRIEKGQRVRITETVEIGKIATVNNTTAIVKLYTTPGTKTPVEINSSGPLVIAEGVGAGSYTLHVPRSFEVRVGEYLTRPGTDAVIIGVVESIEKSETDSFSLVRARLPINIFEATWAYIETEEQDLP
ncbi:MAG: rod shape-determining protein MreC [Candidatus Paceibacterota bacterium]